MSGSKDEGALLGGVRATAQPCGRGFLVTRREGSRLVQVALSPDPDEEPAPDDHPSGQHPVIA
jgi:S-DNA-T family DNA segregation ATPase FtsK/SpoIIIE